ncbi:MAG: ABC transporter substrate-binding protein [Methanosarcinales archaeon]|nr:ABC transporter substrate-binding protein [Methanosarcinales archaeon]
MKIRTLIIGIFISFQLLMLPGAASESTLDIFGNANEDDCINMQDVTYTELIILEYKEPTQLSDARYDDSIDILDVTQIELIILGKEKKLTFLDGFKEVMTVSKPVERVVSVWCTNNELLKVLDVTDTIVGVDDGMTKQSTTLFPELSGLPDCGGWYAPNFEAILSQYPDMYIPWLIIKADEDYQYGITRKMYLEDNLPDVPVLCIDNNEYCSAEYYMEEVERLGYIFDTRDKAREFTVFYQDCMDQVTEKSGGIPDADKTRVWVTSLFFSGGEVSTSPYAYTIFDPVDLAGGKNIADELGPISPGTKVDLEWLIEQNPEFILLQIWAAGNKKSPYAPDYPILSSEEQVNIVLNTPELANVNAVKNNRVYVIQYSHFTKGPARSICTAYLAKLFYPELFDDLDPLSIHQEYIDQFLGIDVTLNSANFLYPLPEW